MELELVSCDREQAGRQEIESDCHDHANGEGGPEMDASSEHPGKK
jgi:hypothetical protein